VASMQRMSEQALRRISPWLRFTLIFEKASAMADARM